MSAPRKPRRSAAPIDESDLDDMFGALPQHPLGATDEFQARVDAQIGAVSLPKPNSPGVLRIAMSTLVQTANVLLGSLCVGPRRNNNTASEAADASAESPSDRSHS